jgi:hypothetical protein
MERIKKTRTRHIAATMMIADGVVAMISPRRLALAWVGGPRFWGKSMEWLAKHPTTTRMIGAVEAAAGVALWAGCQKGIAVDAGASA